MKFQFNDQQLNNLLIFLDRVEIKGLKENQAFTEILSILNNPIPEDSREEIQSE